MRATISEFLQPYLGSQETLETELEAEQYAVFLEERLAEAAESHFHRFRKAGAQRGALHALENVVLRHPSPASWRSYLEHEVERKSGGTAELLKAVFGWLPNAEGAFASQNHPVAEAQREAEGLLRSQYRNRPMALGPQGLSRLQSGLAGPGLREFLSRLLGRLLHDNNE